MKTNNISVNKINYIDDGEREHRPPKIQKYRRGTPKEIKSLRR
jgi:hypothetical protein